MMNSYGNCSNFKICNEADDYFKYNDNNQTGEKDYRQLLMSTPPSNINKDAKYGIMVNSTH